MLLHSREKLVMSMAAFFVAACSATSTATDSAVERTYRQAATAPPIIENLSNKQQPNSITLEKIMSDPDWLGRQPQNAYWSASGKSVVFQRKQEGSPVRDTFEIAIESPKTNGSLVPLAKHHEVANGAVYSQDGKLAAWVYEGSIFLKDLETDSIRQLSMGVGSPQRLFFSVSAHLVYQSGAAVYQMDTKTGFTQKLLSWQFTDEPTATKKPKDYIAEEQIKLIEYIAKTRDDAEKRFESRRELKANNDTIAPDALYFDKKHRLVETSISPNLKHAIIVTTEQREWRDKTDIMPNYIKEDGRIKAEEVRRRVADAEPVNHEVWLVDLQDMSKTELEYKGLEGFNEDVLADVKRENAERAGETYETNRLPREIGLIQDWSWSQSAIQWHNSGAEVAIMLEAWDNKDRWIATVDWDKKALVQQHRLHDPAWINYRFNWFGWFNNSDTLYYLSEESGYSNLYTKKLGEKARGLVNGAFEVDEIDLTADDQYFYFQANRSHPGIYEIFRVKTETGEVEALTELYGNTSFQLSPDESKLLLTHSKLVQPPELFVHFIAENQTIQVTDTVSEEFKAFDWVVPQIVPIASSHSEQPVYSRLYTPAVMEQGKTFPAVVFNHGAGYLQNSHLGWSGYFREFMFHSFLVQQGYVVLDMDYRASRGYGRDWRTAIYRRMGTPEIEDLVDGVNWMVDNVQVDRQRVGTYGGSYGGFMTFMALFNEPDLFQAGAALRPVTDWAHYNIPYTSNILNTPEVDPIAFERSSPIYFAEGLEKPLLINAPMIDDNVFFVDVVRLVQRLIELEKEDFETAIYPVEPHGFRQPSSWLDEYRRIYKLFETNLK